MKSIPVPALVAGVVVLLLVAIVIAYKTMNPDTSKTGVGADGKKIDAAAVQTPATPGNKGAAPMAAPNN